MLKGDGSEHFDTFTIFLLHLNLLYNKNFKQYFTFNDASCFRWYRFCILYIYLHSESFIIMYLYLYHKSIEG